VLENYDRKEVGESQKQTQKTRTSRAVGEGKQIVEARWWVEEKERSEGMEGRKGTPRTYSGRRVVGKRCRAKGGEKSGVGGGLIEGEDLNDKV